MGEKMNANRLLMGMLKGKRSLERPRYKWVDNLRWIFEKEKRG
jgi:hypothetical protein